MHTRRPGRVGAEPGLSQGSTAGRTWCEAALEKQLTLDVLRDAVALCEHHGHGRKDLFGQVERVRARVRVVRKVGAGGRRGAASANLVPTSSGLLWPPVLGELEEHREGGLRQPAVVAEHRRVVGRRDLWSLIQPLLAAARTREDPLDVCCRLLVCFFAGVVRAIGQPDIPLYASALRVQ
eukprot:scaffold124879_cov72-Phaeocystis_antarctica.AAC.2